MEVEKGFVDLVKLKTEIWDINDDTGLDTFITGTVTESDIYYNKVDKIISDNQEIFEKCKTLLAPVKAQTSRQAQAQATPCITSGGLKPNQIKDCTLT